MAQYASPSKITSITTKRPAPRHLTVYRPAARSVAARSAALRLAPARSVDKAVYRRRRLLAAGLFLLALAAVLILAQLIQAGIGGGPLTTTGAAAGSGGSAAMIPAGTRAYVVQPGDTLWSIAARIDAKGDERPLVDALSKQLGGQPLYPGERVAIPSHW